jgi:hypothetical protein
VKPPAPKPRPKTQPNTPWQLPATTNSNIFAIQAVAKGIANEGQQRQAWEYILRTLCEIDRMTFWPGGEDGKRATDFAEGKRWVAIQLRRIERLRPDMGTAGDLPSMENYPQTERI